MSDANALISSLRDFAAFVEKHKQEWLSPDVKQTVETFDARIEAQAAGLSIAPPAKRLDQLVAKDADLFYLGYLQTPCWRERRKPGVEWADPLTANARFQIDAADASWQREIRRLQVIAETRAATGSNQGRAGQGKGGTPPTGCSKRVPRAEAEILVREWLAANAKGNPAAITRDAVVAGTGVSAGQVSKTAAWKAFRERRDAEAKPVAREVPLTDAMQAAVPSGCQKPDEIAALIEEQKADEAEQERRHKGRHGPS